ncbi:MAG: hypothetical protein HW421_1421 [Ignavibacteria bacterium]|nr:hypothetical protein [Ignavibacteria bacterium]
MRINNKKPLKITLMLAFTFIFMTGCEQVVEDPQLPYHEQIVISAVLEPGKTSPKISITKTLPPLEDYDIEKATIYDAEAVITCNGVSYLLLIGTDKFYTSPDLTIESGKKYSLIVKWKNKSAITETVVPYPVKIDTSYYKFIKERRHNHTEQYLSMFVGFKPEGNSVYVGFHYQYLDDSSKKISYKYSHSDCLRSMDTNSKGSLTLNFKIYYYGDTTNFKPNSYEDYVIECYDAPYFQYYQTRYNGGEPNELFGTSGSNIIGNVKGDGIGLFIGRAKTILKFD